MTIPEFFSTLILALAIDEAKVYIGKLKLKIKEKMKK